MLYPQATPLSVIIIDIIDILIIISFIIMNFWGGVSACGPYAR